MSLLPTSVWVAVVTVETKAPLLIATGAGDDLRDTVCVTDANGLPALPGSSIAGVLRAACPAEHRDRLFGKAERAENGGSVRSPLTVGWGAVHAQDNQPVSPMPGEMPANDAVLTFLMAGIMRDHVRINARGAADSTGKFDVSSVPVGARFSFELRLDAPTATDIARFMAILASGEFRLGGHTRRGLGLLTLVEIRARTFDFSKAADFVDWKRWAAEPNLASRASQLSRVKVDTSPSPKTVYGRWKLDLTADAAWRVGGGTPGEADQVSSVKWQGPQRKIEAKVVDLAPVREIRILWSAAGRAALSEPALVLPGTAIKGAIRHRTSFHLRRLNGAFGSPDRPCEESDGLEPLFGAVKSSGSEAGVAGLVYIDDVWIADSGRRELQEHVAIDRFSGAPLNGALFSESMVGKTTLTIAVSVAKPSAARNIKPDEFERLVGALDLALQDLAQGRLALGAASSRGHGYFHGTVTR